MTELKSYSEVWKEQKGATITVYILFSVVFFLLASAVTLGPSWYYNVAFALLAAFLLMLACMHFQRYAI